MTDLTHYNEISNYDQSNAEYCLVFNYCDTEKILILYFFYQMLLYNYTLYQKNLIFKRQ